MKHLFLITVVLSLTAMKSHAGSNYSADWQKGNSFYQQKQYDSAVYYFEQIAALKPQNAEVYYNLGNTYYRLNKISLAVLNYERAIRIKPTYKEAKDNLMLAQGRITNHLQAAGDIFFVGWWQNITNPDKATGWAISALVIFAIIILLAALRALKKDNARYIPRQLTTSLGLICLCLLVLAFFSAKNSDSNMGAVVMVGEAPLMNNDLKGAPLVLVPEGTVVRIKGEKGNWREVSLPDGRTGWLQQSLLEKI